jgi:uncharacterized protein (TIGR02246 family)
MGQHDSIDRVRRMHVAAVNRGEAEAWVGTFAEDGVQMPPHARANVGRDAILGWAHALCGAFDAEFSLSVEEVRAAGGWAFERGAYAIALTPRAGGGGPIRETGTYVTIYGRRRDGAWEIARDRRRPCRPIVPWTAGGST